MSHQQTKSDQHLNFAEQAKVVITDSHFLVPFCVLAAGIILLVWLH